MVGSYIVRAKKDPINYMAVDISGLCHLHCRMCSLPKWFRHRGVMPLEAYKKLESVLSEINHVELQSNCEPLLNGRIVEFIRFTKKVNKKIKVSFITNGLLLTSSLISQMLKAGVNKISVSIDGATKETYENIRAGANFEKVIENIGELVRQQRFHEETLEPLEFIAVASKMNVKELPGIIDLAKKCEVPRVAVNGLEAYDKEMAGNVLYVQASEKISLKYARVFSAMRDKALCYGIELKLPLLKAVPYSVCHFKGCVVNWDGSVSPCPVLTYRRPYWYFGQKHMHSRIVFGNINQENFWNIWNSQEFVAFRKHMQNGCLPRCCSQCLLQHRVLCGN
jgi:MoaA/NifB/PqqE/SkfB family radical SAM enzyme